MSAYGNDPRVTYYRDDLFEVDASDGRHSVIFRWDAWFVVTEPGGRFSEPLPSADEAIHSLIGDPQ